MIFTYLVRHNNSEAILSAESKMMDLFFTRNHPVYREIIYQYFKIETLIPQKAKDALHKSLAVSRTDRDQCYQGGDAALEEILIKQRKNLLLAFHHICSGKRVFEISTICQGYVGYVT